MIDQTNRRRQYLRGLRAGIPVIFGFIPVGIAYAIMARQAGFSALQTCLMSLTVFAGASQMMAVGMYAQGAGVVAMIVATFILNLRHVIMSTCVAERMPRLSLWQKLLAGFGVTDESFAIFTTEKRKISPCGSFSE
jgi:4-azaleucine resistance transporter AzlC